jgi:hypothetical protein
MHNACSVRWHWYDAQERYPGVRRCGLGVSRATVSRRWELPRPAIGQVLAEFVPHPRELAGTGTALVDGSIGPCWDGKRIPDLYSAKAGYLGMNIQIAATLSGCRR